MITQNRQVRFLSLWDCECDKCSEYEEVEAPSFSGAVRELKLLGWVIRKRMYRGVAEWEHVCQACVEKEEEKHVSKITFTKEYDYPSGQDDHEKNN